MTPTPAIEASDVSLHAGKHCLLAGVSLRANAGERIAIVGANGAGKTTLLRCLLGLATPDSGSICLEGKPATSFKRQDLARMISYVPQQLGSDIPFTVREFVLMSRYTHASGIIPVDHEGHEIARETMRRIGIDHLADRTFATLSGGERQKASIAAALCQHTPVIVLDEPAAHLDPKQRETIQSLLSTIGRKSNTTVITVTHDLNWAAMDFDRMVGMKDGRIVLDAAPNKFMSTENLEQIFDATWDIQPHPQSGCPMIIPSHHRHTATSHD
ncbi:ferrichrome ABC transporter ATP-binding protein [Oceaniferula spumae]|uniref:Ferrichrome ABC transporter ATP-binding protein n=1 Tax=Oceaniferula spumae TaxID=2979115 RepID=A0AAT9FPX2_9BACT